MKEEGCHTDCKGSSAFKHGQPICKSLEKDNSVILLLVMGLLDSSFNIAFFDFYRYYFGLLM